MAGAGVTGVDLDHCIGLDGTLSPLAQELINLTHTYCEVSPSGTGLRMFLRGEGWDKKNHEIGVEVFHTKGFLTVTGNGVNGADIMPMTPQIETRLRELSFPSKAKGAAREGYGDLGRNCNLTSTAGRLVNAGFGAEEIEARLKDANARTDIPLPERDVRTVARSSQNFEVANRLTDYGNAERLVAQHGENLRFIAKIGKWMVWGGQRWLIDEDGAFILRLAKHTVRSIYKEAADADDADRRKALSQWGKLSEASARLTAMIGLAWSEPGMLVQPDELDADPWLLGVANGTLDLRSGKLLQPRREDLIAKGTEVDYQPDAQCPRWLQFLSEIMGGRQEMVDFLQVAIGYTLTGLVSEQCLFLMHGSGSNGKTTMLNVLLALMGEHGMQAAAQSLMERKNDDGPREDLARLRGARFVATSEVGEGKRLAEALVKQMTGNDRIVTRFLFGRSFEYVPTFKIWLAANHKPTIVGTDYAMWRRIHLIPFEVKFAEGQKDEGLTDKLLAELPGILNWALEGCKRWQAEGLQIPEEVKAATAEYRRESDLLEQWLEECCMLGEQYQEKSSELYSNYRRWAEVNAGSRAQVMTKNAFGEELKKRFQRARRNFGNVYVGVGLSDGQNDEELEL